MKGVFMSGSRPKTVEECKVQAKILLKQLRSANQTQSLSAAARFQLSPQWAQKSALEIVAQSENVKLKHALQVIARENRCETWEALKTRLEKLEALRGNRQATDLYPRRCWGYLCEWYADYETARRHREEVGGYLFPYRSQFFLATRGYVETLGLDPDDADWTRIGWDWARPADQAAWARLNQQLPGGGA
jgi:hypothetical protein